MKKEIVQLLGPTGSGKSRMAVALACRFNGEVISADAFQVYRGFDIGTDKIDVAQRGGIPHHLIDVTADCRQFNAWHFLHESFRAAEGIVARGRLPIVCGGTALYLQVQISGIFPESKDGGETRRELERELAAKGLAALWNELAAADPEYAQKIGPRDRLRIIRGLEILRLNGIPPSKIFARSETPFGGYRFIRIGLDVERGDLYQRINRRVERMVASGLVEEVRELRKSRAPDCPPFRGVGYKEILQYLDGEMDLERAVNLIKMNSRRFAKRQLTWFRREKDIAWFAAHDEEKITAYLEGQLWKEQ